MCAVSHGKELERPGKGNGVKTLYEAAHGMPVCLCLTDRYSTSKQAARSPVDVYQCLYLPKSCNIPYTSSLIFHSTAPSAIHTVRDNSDVAFFISSFLTPAIYGSSIRAGAHSPVDVYECLHVSRKGTVS